MLDLLQWQLPPTSGRAAPVPERLGLSHLLIDVPDLDAVLAEGVDALIVTSSSPGHAPAVRAGLAAGIPIFCEKPVDMSVPRARECAAAVQAAGVACMIGFQRRFDPTFNEARTRMDRGEIGNPEMLVITSRDPGAPPAASPCFASSIAA